MEQVLHLFIINTCRHDCPLCCNKFYDIEKIPVVTVERLKSVDTVCLTGGEPLMLHDNTLYDFVFGLRVQYPNIKNLYVYTSGKELSARRDTVEALVNGSFINGVNVSPKDGVDWMGLATTIREAPSIFRSGSNRLYVFEEQQSEFAKWKWQFSGKSIDIIGRKWDRVFNTNGNEYFERLPILFRCYS